MKIKFWNLIDPPKGAEPIERKWNYKETDMDDLIHKRLDLSRLVEKSSFTTKFKELTTKGLDR